MQYQPELQPRDWLILEPLAHCYRTTTARYEAIEHSISESTAHKRLNRLVEGRFLNRLTVWASEIPAIHQPLCEWQVGDPPPEFGAIAYAAQQRWADRPIRQTTVYTANRKLLAMFGLSPRSNLKKHHATHDLALLVTYRYCRQRWPHLRFVGEDIFAPDRGHGEGVEDALLFDGDSAIAAVEYAGSYRTNRVAHFHNHVSERQLPYYLF